MDETVIKRLWRDQWKKVRIEDLEKGDVIRMFRNDNEDLPDCTLHDLLGGRRHAYLVVGDPMRDDNGHWQVHVTRIELSLIQEYV